MGLKKLNQDKNLLQIFYLSLLFDKTRDRFFLTLDEVFFYIISIIPIIYLTIIKRALKKQSRSDQFTTLLS
jgi:hypothetical protein